MRLKLLAEQCRMHNCKNCPEKTRTMCQEFKERIKYVDTPFQLIALEKELDIYEKKKGL